MSFTHSLLACFGICLLSSVLIAQQLVASPSSNPRAAVVPRLVNFSGKVTDEQGKPLPGFAGVTFAIYKDQNEGPPLWLETQNVTADARGNYTVQLGATKPAGLPLDLFSSGEAHWLGVQVSGQVEQARVLLLSVPYALKAADAETIGGLPPSAFMRASSAAITAGSAGSPDAARSTSAIPPALSDVTTTGGSVNALPLFTSATNVQSSAITQTGSGTTARIGVNTAAPTTTLDIHGGAAVRGTLVLPATGVASATAGKTSQPEEFVASSFSGASNVPVNQTFQWQAEPANNNTANPGATLNLLYGLGAAKATETGLRIGPKGIIGFAAGQTFPGTGPGSVKSVGLSAPTSDFIVNSSPVTSSGTLALSWNVAPTNGDTSNAIVKRDVNGSFTAGAITANLGMEGITALDSGNGVAGINSGAGTAVYGGGNQGVGVWGQSFGNGPVSDGVHGVTGSSSGSGVAGINNGGGIGVYGTGGTGVFGTGSAFGMVTDSNVQQARTAGGWVKAMVFASGNSGNIIRCFNSTLSGAAASNPPCGFTLDKTGTGDYIIDFGFEVDDRFFTATPTTNGLEEINALEVCTLSLGVVCNSNITANEVEVWSLYTDDYGGYRDTKFFLIVY
jgi:hypothetical protein